MDRNKFFDFLRKHMPHHRLRQGTKGEEFLPIHCPFCGGGRNRQKYTFSVNIDQGTYICNRMNNCGVRGTAKMLYNHFEGESFVSFKPKNIYKPPKTKPAEPKSKICSYIESRGLDLTLAIDYGIKESAGHIAINYVENGVSVLVKHRDIEDKKKQWVDKNGKPVLFGMGMLREQHDSLLITEGEWDAIAVATAIEKSGKHSNVLPVSLPFGAGKFECVDNCWDWIRKFKQVYIWRDNDEVGIESGEQLAKRIGRGSCLVIDVEEKDANELLQSKGAGAVIVAIDNAEQYEDDDIVRACDQKVVDITSVHSIPTGFGDLDRVIGGLRMGEVTLVTGENSSGKTTIINEVCLYAVDAGEGVTVYSGEFAPGRLTEWIDLQAAGAPNIVEIKAKNNGATFYKTKSNVVQQIHDWYSDKLYFYTPKRGVNVRKNILDAFMYSYQRYGTKLFIIDNLAKCMVGVPSNEKNREQGDFMNDVVEFAHDTDTHVIIVAHPKKASEKGHVVEKDDVGGSGDLTNLVDNVWAVIRMGPNINPKAKEKKELYDSICKSKGLDKFDMALAIYKNRFMGRQDVFIPLCFDVPSRRFYGAFDTPDHQFGWKTKPKESEEITLFNETGGAF